MDKAEKSVGWTVKLGPGIFRLSGNMPTRWGREDLAPYVDKYKQALNSPECPVGAKCQGKGGVPPACRNPFAEN